MRIGFRQGIIKGQRLPDFLIKNGNNVSFNASKMPTLLNFAEGSSNYLLHENTSVDNAWTVPNNQECWLYWDISKETGVRTFGYTTLNPFIKREPTTLVVGQMFFDTSSMRYKVWNGQSWTDIIRLIAGYVSSDGILTVQANGSQVDVVTSVMLDEIVFDVNGLPIKKFTDSGFEFYTKSNIDEFKSNNKDSFTFDRITQYNGKAEIAMTQHSCVSWKDGNTLILADPNNIKNKAFALVERTVDSGELVSLQTKGFVTNRFQWNWTEPCNTPIFLGNNGSISTRLSNSNSIQKIGYIVSPNTIYLNFAEQYINYNSVSYQDTIITPTPSPSITPSITPTLSLSPTPTMTATITPTLTPTITPTLTPTISVSFSPTITPSMSLSATPSVTASPTPTLTPTISAGPTDPYFSSVSSLMHFDGVNGSTSFTDQIGTSWTAGGTATITTSNSVFGGASGNFDGTTGYVQTPSSSLFDFGSGDFTIEAFVNVSSTLPSYAAIVGKHLTNSADNTSIAWLFGANTGQLSASVYSGSTAFTVTDSATLPLNTWTHVVMERYGSNLLIFKNGIQVGSLNIGTVSLNVGASIPVSIGHVMREEGIEPGLAWIGYIDELRITKGIARYTTNFTPPTSAFPNSGSVAPTPSVSVSSTPTPTPSMPSSDPYFSSVASLLHFDGVNGSTVFTDQTGRTWTTNGSASISTTQSMFGGSSGNFPYNTDSPISTADSPSLRFGTADFTVEGWFLPSAPQVGFGVMFIKGLNTTDGVSIGITPTTITFRCNGTTDYTASVSIASWSHIAVVRASGVVNIYLNGVQVLSQAVTFNHTSTDVLYVGSNAASGGDIAYSYSGYIDEFRLTNGVARYTSNFTPPTSAFPNIGVTPTPTATSTLTPTPTPSASVASSDPYAANVTSEFAPVYAGNNTVNDDKTNTWTNAGNVAVQAGQGYGGTDAVYFDGTGAIVSESSSNFGYGTGDYTIELYANFTNLTSGPVLFDQRPSGTNGSYPEIGLDSAGNIGFYFNGNVMIVSAAPVVVTGVYKHIALSRVAGVTRLFYDGQLVGSPYTDSSNIPASSMTIGRNAYNTSVGLMTGYICQFKVTKGVGRYTANFTPPAVFGNVTVTPSPTPTPTPTPSVGSTDPYFADVVSLMHFNGSNGSPMIVDVTGRTWTSTNGPALSTTQSKFGGSSLYFVNNYSYIDSTITSIGTSDFTIEGFVNWAGITSNFSFFFDYRSLSTNGIFPCVYISTNGTVHYFVNNGDQIASASSLTANTWYHIALCRSGGVTRLFINGVQAGVNYTDTNNYVGSNLRLGGSGFDPNSGVQFGYIDEFRATYGYGRYTANFTPPTMPFPNQ